MVRSLKVSVLFQTLWLLRGVLIGSPPLDIYKIYECKFRTTNLIDDRLGEMPDIFNGVLPFNVHRQCFCEYCGIDKWFVVSRSQSLVPNTTDITWSSHWLSLTRCFGIYEWKFRTTNFIGHKTRHVHDVFNLVLSFGVHRQWVYEYCGTDKWFVVWRS